MEIDISCDIGEGFGPYRITDDEALLQIVTSANVACGFHAGDPNIMASTIQLAEQNRVAIGAHIGKPDLAGFGRREIALTSDEIFNAVIYQCGALSMMCQAFGTRMDYVSFHGDLGGIIGRDVELSKRLIAVWLGLGHVPKFQGMPNSPIFAAAQQMGMETIPVFLSDRAYTRDGTLVPRNEPGAVIHDLAAVLARVRTLVTQGSILASDGSPINIACRSIVIHSDTPGAVELGRAIRGELEALGVRVRPPK